MGSLKFYIKTMKNVWFVLLIVLIAQLFTTKMNAYFMKTTSFPNVIEVVDLEGSQQSATFIGYLEKNPELKVIRQKSFDSNNLRKGKSKGVLVIENNFSEKLEQGETELLTLYPTSGMQDVATLKEIVLANVLKLKGASLYRQTLSDFGVKVDEKEELPVKELFNVVYYNRSGEIVQGGKKEDKPYFSLGCASLFILVQLLIIKSYLPGADQKRYRFYGSNTLLKHQMFVCLILVAVWTIGFGLFMGVMPQVMIGRFPDNTFLYLEGLLLYTTFLGVLLVNSGLRNWLVYFFTPWFILNMTIGGALWGTGTKQIVWQSLFPVSFVVNEQLGLLLIIDGLLLVFCVIMRKCKKLDYS